MKIERVVPSAWNLHVHSRFSNNDALPTVESIVTTVRGYGQKAIGLTDHGNMAGSVQLYKHAKLHGLLPFPGTELYVVPDRGDKKAKRHHMCAVAFTTKGYSNLARLSSLTHRNFYHKPLIDHSDLAELAQAGMLEGIAATSGCYFGLISQAVVKGDEFAATQLMQTYDSWFDRFYVELQNHNIDHDDGWTDDMLADNLWSLARQIGIPCVVTQDSHYCHEEEKDTHDTLKRLVAFGPDPDDAVFPGDGFHLADRSWFRLHHSAQRYAAGVEGLDDLVAAHDLSIPQLDSYHYNIPFTVADPQAELLRRCNAALTRRKLGTKYDERLAEELSIITDTGMAGYLILVAEVTDWCRENRIFYQARGSASGSVVCWLLGITQADPLKWGLDFTRFISRDRTKPPDIDLDVEHTSRGELIEWLSMRFSVCQIGTWLEYSLHDEGEGAKGSLRVKYFAAASRRGDTIKTWDEVPEADKASLYRLGEAKPFSSYGVHAAGLVVTTNEDEMHDLIPTMKVASSQTQVTQYEMNDVEALGLVKLDVLGLKTLTVLHRTMDNLGRDVFDGLDWIELTDAKTYREISKGRTSGVFQLEGGSARFGVKELKPTKISDVIAAMALFRPAPMNSGATASYIARKHRKEENRSRHEVIDKNTKATYGILLFQEQVISILRDMGMDPDSLTRFLKAVKASNSNIGDAGKVIEGYREWFWETAVDLGMSKADLEWLWESMTGFAAYGFNQAHSTAYGITAYRCAYLATHHPLEFFAALLSVAAGSPKERDYVVEARKRGLRVVRADVAVSGLTYAVDHKRQRIVRGLTSIKGIGESVAHEIVSKRPEGGFASLTQMCELVDQRKVSGAKAYLKDKDTSVGKIGVLHEYGALESVMFDE